MAENEHKPVYMMVMGRVGNRELMAAYAKALAESGLYEETEGYYTAFGKPAEMFEGDWPEAQSLVLARFPSREHARRFWYSDAYQQEVKPLRAGAGDFTVAVFEELPAPARIGWLGRDESR